MATAISQHVLLKNVFSEILANFLNVAESMYLHPQIGI